MTEIPCQAKHREDGGCSTCGGYGVVLVQSKLPCCGKLYWHRPGGGFTVYEGKRWTSIDGVDTVWTLGGQLCEECYALGESKET